MEKYVPPSGTGAGSTGGKERGVGRCKRAHWLCPQALGAGSDSVEDLAESESEDGDGERPRQSNRQEGIALCLPRGS